VRQVGNQSRLYYDARSTNHQDLERGQSEIMGIQYGKLNEGILNCISTFSQ